MLVEKKKFRSKTLREKIFRNNYKNAIKETEKRKKDKGGRRKDG